MKVQKIFVEVYMDDDVDVSEWIKDELIENDRVSYRNVHLISEEETLVSFPDQYEEDIRTIMQNIDDYVAGKENDGYDHDLTPLKNIATGLRSLLK